MRKVGVVAVLALFVASVAAAQDLSWRDFDSPAALAQLIEAQSRTYLLVDVRSPVEYARGHIPSAANVPLAALVADGLDAAADDLVIVYCASGNRSGQAAKFLEEHGYTRVVDFGGIGRWEGDLEVGPSQDGAAAGPGYEPSRP